MEIILGRRFVMKQRISSGAFGEIYEGYDRINNKKVALKLEKIKSNRVQLLGEEAKIYKDLQGFVGFPEFYWFGSQVPYNILAIELLDNSLEGYLSKCGGKFSVKTVLMLADQMISALECFHRHYYIHRDLKPENFMMGSGEKSDKVYLIDYGLSKKYVDIKNDFSHIPFKNHKNMTGTARYASINSLAGVEQSRRDDMESLGYIFVYFLKGKLPWQGLPGKTRDEKYGNILDSKQSTPIEELCSGIPPQFSEYLQLVRELDYTEEPSYSYYRQMFRKLFIEKGFVYDLKYDWTIASKETQSVPVPHMPPLVVPSLMSQQPQTSHMSARSSRKDASPTNEPINNFDTKQTNANSGRPDFPSICKQPQNPNIRLRINQSIRNRRSSYVPPTYHSVNSNFSGRSGPGPQTNFPRQPPISPLKPNISNFVNPINSCMPKNTGFSSITKVLNVINNPTKTGQWKI